MTTMHSIERAKERAGINARAAEHLMKNALERGRDKAFFGWKQQNWLISKEAACGCRALVYNDYCFIVSQEDVVITLYELPEWFTPKKRYYDGKERIRNRVRYEKLNYERVATSRVM